MKTKTPKASKVSPKKSRPSAKKMAQAWGKHIVKSKRPRSDDAAASPAPAVSPTADIAVTDLFHARMIHDPALYPRQIGEKRMVSHSFKCTESEWIAIVEAAKAFCIKPTAYVRVSALLRARRALIPAPAEGGPKPKKSRQR